MNKNKFFIFFIITFFFPLKANVFEIKTVVKIDEKNITNYDFQQHINLEEFLEKRKISDSEKQILINNIIDLKIKEIELDKLNIKANKKSIEKKLNNILKQNFKDLQINDEIKYLLYKKIETQDRWNRLVIEKFRDKLEVNMNEFNEIVKINKLDKKKKDRLFLMQKEKKINSISKTYFNEIKSSYLIKFL